MSEFLCSSLDPSSFFLNSQKSLPDNISTEEKRRLGRVKTSVVELKTQPGNYDENPNNEVRILG
jgi:hypothetical protein